MLELYDYYRSSACFRVRITLNLKALDYKIIPIHLLNQGGEQFFESYRALNPQCLVPSLKDGAHLLTQSFAILEYLEELHPMPAILPKSPYEKALVRAFALTIVADVHPLNNLRVLKYLSSNLHITEEQKQSWIQYWITMGLLALEKKLNQQEKPHEFCFAAYPTMADICLIPQLYNARRFACNLSAYPRLTAIEKNCLQLAAFADAAPKEVAV